MTEPYYGVGKALPDELGLNLNEAIAWATLLAVQQVSKAGRQVYGVSGVFFDEDVVTVVVVG